MRRLRVTTPELVPLEYRLAGVGERGLAWMLDELVVLTATAVLGFLALLFGMLTAGLGLLPGFALVVIARFVLDLGYRVVAEVRWRGRTWGKRMFGLRTVQRNGAALHLWQSVLRNIARPLDALPLFSLLGALLIVLDPLGRRAGDHLAGTVVIRDVRHAPPRSSRLLAGAQNSLLADASAAARIRRRLGAREAAILAEFVAAAPRIDTVRRLETAQRIALHYRRELALEAHRGLPDEALLRAIVGVIASDRFGAATAGVALAGRAR